MILNFRFSVILLLSFAGCQSNFYSEKDFSSIKKVDAHVHVWTDESNIEDQAIKDNFRIITINVDHGDSASLTEQQNYSLRVAQKFPDRVFYAPTFYFDTTGFDKDYWSSKTIAQLQKYITKSAVSVKLWKNIGMTVKDKEGNFIMVDNPKLDPVIDFIISQNLPITGHLGEPKSCWLPFDKMTVKSDSVYYVQNPKYHMFLHPEYPSYEDQINARDHMLEKHPDLKFIGCHLGSLEWSIDELSKRLDKFPNMAVDMAERIIHIQYQSVKDYDKVRNFCIKYQDRLLYGTDLIDRGNGDAKFVEHIHDTWTKDWRYFATDNKMTTNYFPGTIKGLKLPKEVINKIFSENAVKWYKLAP